MKLRFSIWSILLHFLAVMCFHGNGAREELIVAPKIPTDDLAEGVNVLQLHSMDIGREENEKDGMEMEDNRLHGHGDHGHGHSSTHMHDHDHSGLDLSKNLFFSIKDLKPGKTTPLYFAKRDPASSPWLQSKEEADSIPFSYSQFPQILELFSISPGSPQAKSMEDTLRVCEVDPIKKETKFCATSKESMLEFVQTMLGLDSKHFRALPTSYLTNSTAASPPPKLLQNYTILEVPKEVPFPNKVNCHTMPYPYVIYYCHMQGGENKVFEVSLKGENGDRVDTVSVCHLDTSGLGRENVLFRYLNINHGAPICHFFPVDDLIWVPTTTVMNNN